MSDIFNDFPIIQNGETEKLNNSEELISESEAEILNDYPDSSPDVDIDLKYKRFVDYFLVCQNKTKAAKLAGFSASTADSLKAQACKAFKRDDVQLYYKLKKAELAKMSDISFESYMSELVCIATLDIRDVVETEVVPTLTNETVYAFHFKNIEDIPDAARKAIKSIEIAKDGSPRMVFYDKLQALKMIGEIKGYMRYQSDEDDFDGGTALIPSVLPDDASEDVKDL